MTVPEQATEPATPVSPTPEVGVAPPVIGVRSLIGTSLDLLLRVGGPMRRASFYVGLLVLGTVGPVILALWSLVVVGDSGDILLLESPSGAPAGWYAVLLLLAAAGVFVVTVESQAIVLALLGSHLVERPITVRAAVQRSRMVFWPLVAASFVVGIPATVVQTVIGQETQPAILAGLVAGIAIQAPFVYAAAGIVLGGVGPIESLRRSIRVALARKVAAAVLAVLPTVFGLLVLVAFDAGVDLALRSIDAVGLGTDSGPLGVAVLTVVIVVLVFAIGTLVLTAAGIIYAPQVVMFVALTHATYGLDHVRPGGSHAPESPLEPGARFRWLTRPMRLGMLLGIIGLAGFLASVGG